MGICISKSSGSTRQSPRESTASGFESSISALRVSLGTPADRLRRGGDAPLEPHQIQQAAYHVGACVVGDDVTSPIRLATAGQTVHDVRLLLKHGRGNVKVDDIPSHGHNSIGSSVAMMGADDNIKVAVAVVMGAACCNQTAPLSAIVHAPHMAADERSMTSSASVSMKEITDQGDEIPVKTGHIWNELRRGSRDPRSTVVMDAWANGPAVRLKDSAWSGVPVKEGHWSMDKSTAEFLKNRVEGLIPFAHPDTNEQTANDLRRKQNAPVSWKKYAEVQVISPEFADSVRNALSRIPEGQQREIASLMIQEAYGMDPSSRTHQDAVESVLVAANQLDSLPRPPVAPPELAVYHQFDANQQAQAHAVPGMQDILPHMPPPQHAWNANLDGHIAGLQAEVRATGAQTSRQQLRRGGEIGQSLSHPYNHAREDLMAASRSRDRSGR